MMLRVDYVRAEAALVHVHAIDLFQEEEAECKAKTISIQDPYMIDWEIASHVVECVVEDYKLTIPLIIITTITSNNKYHAVEADNA
jgi:hypothetical protein